MHAAWDFPANTNVIAQGGRTYAIVEAGARPYELTEELETKGQAPRFAPHRLQWLQTRIGTDPGQSNPVPPVQLTKLCYTGQKLGRHWASYTNPVQ